MIKKRLLAIMLSVALTTSMIGPAYAQEPTVSQNDFTPEAVVAEEAEAESLGTDTVDVETSDSETDIAESDIAENDATGVEDTESIAPEFAAEDSKIVASNNFLEAPEIEMGKCYTFDCLNNHDADINLPSNRQETFVKVMVTQAGSYTYTFRSSTLDRVSFSLRDADNQIVSVKKGDTTVEAYARRLKFASSTATYTLSEGEYYIDFYVDDNTNAAGTVEIAPADSSVENPEYNLSEECVSTTAHTDMPRYFLDVPRIELGKEYTFDGQNSTGATLNLLNVDTEGYAKVLITEAGNYTYTFRSATNFRTSFNLLDENYNLVTAKKGSDTIEAKAENYRYGSATETLALTEGVYYIKLWIRDSIYANGTVSIAKADEKAANIEYDTEETVAPADAHTPLMTNILNAPRIALDTVYTYDCSENKGAMLNLPGREISTFAKVLITEPGSYTYTFKSATSDRMHFYLLDENYNIVTAKKGTETKKAKAEYLSYGSVTDTYELTEGVYYIELYIRDSVNANGTVSIASVDKKVANPEFDIEEAVALTTAKTELTQNILDAPRIALDTVYTYDCAENKEAMLNLPGREIHTYAKVLITESGSYTYTFKSATSDRMHFYLLDENYNVLTAKNGSEAKAEYLSYGSVTDTYELAEGVYYIDLYIRDSVNANGTVSVALADEAVTGPEFDLAETVVSANDCTQVSQNILDAPRIALNTTYTFDCLENHKSMINLPGVGCNAYVKALITEPGDYTYTFRSATKDRVHFYLLDENYNVVTAKSGENLQEAKAEYLALASASGTYSLKKGVYYIAFYIYDSTDANGTIMLAASDKKGMNPSYDEEEKVIDTTENTYATGNIMEAPRIALDTTYTFDCQEKYNAMINIPGVRSKAYVKLLVTEPGTYSYTFKSATSGYVSIYLLDDNYNIVTEKKNGVEKEAKAENLSLASAIGSYTLKEGVYYLCFNANSNDVNGSVLVKLSSSDTGNTGSNPDEKTVPTTEHTIVPSNILDAPRIALNNMYTFDYQEAYNAMLNLQSVRNNAYVKVIVTEPGNYNYTVKSSSADQISSSLLDENFEVVKYTVDGVTMDASVSYLSNKSNSMVLPLEKGEYYISLKVETANANGSVWVGNEEKEVENPAYNTDEKVAGTTEHTYATGNILEAPRIALDTTYTFDCMEKHDAMINLPKTRSNAYVKLLVTEPGNYTYIFKSATNDNVNIYLLDDNYNVVTEKRNGVEKEAKAEKLALASATGTYALKEGVYYLCWYAGSDNVNGSVLVKLSSTDTGNSDFNTNEQVVSTTVHTIVPSNILDAPRIALNTTYTFDYQETHNAMLNLQERRNKAYAKILVTEPGSYSYTIKSANSDKVGFSLLDENFKVVKYSKNGLTRDASVSDLANKSTTVILPLEKGVYYISLYLDTVDANGSVWIGKHVHKWKDYVQQANTYSDGLIESRCEDCDVLNTRTVINSPKIIYLSATSFVYNGKPQVPAVIVKDAKGNVISSANYTVRPAYGSTNVGTYSCQIDFKGNYFGSEERSYTIYPAGTSLSKLTKQKKGFTAKWKTNTSQVSGYQIQYATNSKFTGAKTKTVKKNKTSKLTIKKLKAKKKYYVRIRTYTNVDGIKYVSAWSKAKKVTTKK